MSGGNSRFTAGAIRFAYNGLDDLQAVMPDLTETEIETTDFGTYTEDQFFDDMFRVTQHRTDPDLCEVLVRQSFSTIRWMREKGVRFVPLIGSATKRGIDVWYDSRALELITDGVAVTGVKIRRKGQIEEVAAKSVILAAGGFQASTEMRTRYLGPNWDLAKVRGTPYNTGDGIRMAMEIGASSAGNWSGCHAVGWERNAPEFGDLAVGDGFQKHSYPFGIIVNAKGERFVDEGADFRNYTYAKYGREVLAQPGHFAWQIFDKKTLHLLRGEYRIREVTKVSADTIEELATKLEGVDPEGFIATVKAYNEAVQTDIPFNPNVKDGRATKGLSLPKSNWANQLTEAPFEAYAITCGITFTFGGLRIDTDAKVQSTDYTPIPGLFAAGEMVGGIFYNNYPGGTGLMNGAVFGKIAGKSAAAYIGGKS